MAILGDRASAVQYLRELGCKAFERDWILGQSIGVPLGAERNIAVGGETITMWSSLLYVYPMSDGWKIWTEPPWPEDELYMSLDAAVREAANVWRASNEVMKD